jgi:hypothetical protein
MKKFKVSINDGAEQEVFASTSGTAVLRCRLWDAFKKLKSGESQTVTASITRMPYTKGDDEARRGANPRRYLPKPEPPKPKVGDIIWSEWGAAKVHDVRDDGQVLIQLVPQVGDVYTTGTGDPVGVVTKIGGGTCGIKPLLDELPVGQEIFCPSLAARMAKMRYDMMKEGQQLNPELKALGL